MPRSHGPPGPSECVQRRLVGLERRQIGEQGAVATTVDRSVDTLRRKAVVAAEARGVLAHEGGIHGHRVARGPAAETASASVSAIAATTALMTATAMEVRNPASRHPKSPWP